MTKPYNLKSQIRSALRRVWLYSPMRRNALTRMRVSRGVYKCPKCLKFVGPKQSDVDHIKKVTPNEGINKPEDWGIYIKNLLYIPYEDPLSVEGVCKDCHKIKTLEERREVKRSKTSSKKTKKRSRSRTNRSRKKRTSRLHTRRTRRNVY